MALDIIKFIKGIVVKNETDTTKQLELSVSASATTGTKTTLEASQAADITLTLPNTTGTILNTSSAINATQIGAGSVNNTEYGYLDGVTSPIQTQLNAVSNAITSLTGDVTASGPGAAAATLATVNSNVGTFGSTTSASQITVNAKGLITAASNQTIAIPGTQITSAVPVTAGGTGETTKTAAFDGLSPTSTKGDLISRNSSSNVAVPVGTDGFVLTADSSQATGLKWSQVNGIKNYILNGDAESNSTTGWATYADAAGAQPVDGTGGSPTVTFSASPTSPLRGGYSFILTKTATNSQGQGVSYDFTIDAADKAKPLNVSFDYLINSGTYVDGDLTVYLYDITNAQVIQPAGYTILNATISETQKATFQTNSNSTSYRLIFHCASTSASAYTVKIDNIVVGPIVTTIGPAVTDWSSFIPTGSWVSNTTYAGQWRRVGDTAEYDILVSTTAAPTSTSLTVNLFPGHVIDTTKHNVTNSLLGDAQPLDAGINEYRGQVRYNSTTSVNVRYLAGGAPVATANVTDIAPFTFGNTDSVRITFRIPIVGWSSNSIVSSDTDTRVVAARYSTFAGQAVTNGSTNTINFDTKDFDTHGAVTTGGSWNFRVPVPGKYRVSFSVLAQAAAGTFQFNLRKNGVLYSELYRNLTSNQNLWSGDDLVDCLAGDTLDIQLANASGGTITLNTSAPECKISIERLSGPSQISASETVSALYTGAPPTGTLNGSYNTTTFGTKVKDSHGAYSSGSYTVPVSGTYSIQGQVGISATYAASNAAAIAVYVDGSVKYEGAQTAGGANGTLYPLVSVNSIPLLAGQVVTIRSLSSGSSPSFSSVASINYFSIVRTGNY